LDKEKPFVLVRKDGRRREEFKHFAEALAVLTDGDTIEVHGNGPFKLPRVALAGKSLTWRAGPGYRPEFVPADPPGHDDTSWWSIKKGTLLLEGCVFHSAQGGTCLHYAGPSCEVFGCYFFGCGPACQFEGPLARVRDCQIIGGVAVQVAVGEV